jgi:glutamate dehydrogenase/leucine dehydrogenase
VPDAEHRHGELLWRRNILYAPDYVINAGGLISALFELGRCDSAAVIAKTGEIYERLSRTYETARPENVPSDVAARRMVEEKIGCR